eukprot:764989-Hanusia_phi.AAC.1
MLGEWMVKAPDGEERYSTLTQRNDETLSVKRCLMQSFRGLSVELCDQMLSAAGRYSDVVTRMVKELMMAKKMTEIFVVVSVLGCYGWL